MSNIPATFPLAETSSTRIYKVIIIDSGTSRETDELESIGDSVDICVRVENLPDTVDAIDIAIAAARLAYPTCPISTCLALSSIGPVPRSSIVPGHQVIVGRMMNVSAGIPCKTVAIPTEGSPTVGTGTTGSTGAVAFLQMTYTRNHRMSEL